MIYCVEDDTGICDIIVYTLKSVGFEAKGFSDGNSFFVALNKNIPELILLDIMLPGQDGFEILRQLKAKTTTKNIPIIMATAKGSEYDKISGLDLGADDYLVKPFGMMEMVSRIRALLRRTTPQKIVSTLQNGDLYMNLDEHIVMANGERIELTLKEYEILRTLMEKPKIVFNRNKLLSDIWGIDYYGETRTVDVHIRTLRQKLGSYSDIIETVRGVGYRMKAKRS